MGKPPLSIELSQAILITKILLFNISHFIFTQIFLFYGARILFINIASTKPSSAPSPAAKTIRGGVGGGAESSGGSGWSRRAADTALAEAAHADKMMRLAAAAGSAYRSACQTPPAAQLGRCRMRGSFRGKHSFSTTYR